MSTVILIVIVAAGGFFLYQGGYLDSFLGNFSIGGGGGDGGVDVNKKLQFTWTADWSGTAANAKTFYLYDDTMALRETLTTAATGIVATGQNYPSGTLLHVKFVDGNNKIWYDFTVPTMNQHDAESNTYNDISLKHFAIGTYTSDQLMMLGLSVADTEVINATGNATTSPSFIYTLSNTGSDNTGLKESYDPVYGQAWQVWVTGKISGDNASMVIINGADYVFSVGTDQYFAKRISAQELTKWKIGSSYVPGYTGTSSCGWSLDLTAFTTAADTATMQLSVYAYCDPAYAQSHAGNFGASKYEIAEQTVSIVGK
jgi:hypothetical protein